jgi:transglutaminase-like putative cysteine protease
LKLETRNCGLIDVSFDTYFRVSSYAMIACGALALAVSGGTGVGLVAVFFVTLVAAWILEKRKWQLSERVGLVVLLVSLPLFYFDWKYQSAVGYLESDGRNHGGIAALVHLTLFLSTVKLLQVKADRDWLFLYLISFFEVLLAAGLSISPLFVVALALYMFCALLTVVCFELRKARRNAPAGEAHLLVAHDARWMKNPSKFIARGKSRALRRLPLAALCLLLLIFALALPIFFITPRFGANALAMAGGGATSYVGFSEQMTLGDIGRLQQNNQVVMRVRVDEPRAERNQNLRWRGVALDRFNGRAWTRSTNENRVIFPADRDLFQLGTTEHLNRLTTQTFFLEPIDTPVLFVASRAVAVQGSLPVVRRDGEGALTTRLHPQERLTYRAYSDTLEPSAEVLRQDVEPYPQDKQRYLQLPPSLDTRIASLAWLIADRAGARTRFDKARAIEAYLNTFGYSLEMRARGEDPLADFLFRVREGHCEYFSSAMVVMLRTQGVAARVVNGFQTGDYNDAADAYTVRQSDAHSWVEVYFPETDAWVTFDPTPPAGRPGMTGATGLRSQFGKYAEALELFWIQYVVAYDRQEQRSLANSLRSHWADYRDDATLGAEALKASLSGWRGLASTAIGASPLIVPTATVAASGALVLVLFVFARRVKRGARRSADSIAEAGQERSVIDFYERMTKALASRGIERQAHQTPLEFAATTGIPEVLTITRAYHRVRYGAQHLLPEEATEVENCLRRMEESGK